MPIDSSVFFSVCSPTELLQLAEVTKAHKRHAVQNPDGETTIANSYLEVAAKLIESVLAEHGTVIETPGQRVRCIQKLKLMTAGFSETDKTAIVRITKSFIQQLVELLEYPITGHTVRLLEITKSCRHVLSTTHREEWDKIYHYVYDQVDKVAELPPVLPKIPIGSIKKQKPQSDKPAPIPIEQLEKAVLDKLNAWFTYHEIANFDTTQNVCANCRCEAMEVIDIENGIMQVKCNRCGFTFNHPQP